MPPSGRELQLRLYRDSLTTPWGFRLQGGRDLNASLAVQKIVPCTPADGELQRGDVILEIQGNDTSKLTHVQAQDLIRKAGGSLLLKLIRTGHVEFIPAPSVPALSQQVRPLPRRNVQAPVNRDFGTDYNRQRFQPAAPGPSYVNNSNYAAPQQGFMLNRVQDSLNNTLWSPNSIGSSASSYYDYSLPQPTSPPGLPFVPRQSWSSSSPSSGSALQPHRASASPALGTSRYNQGPPEEPAWRGSLRSSEKPLSSDSYVAGITAPDNNPPSHSNSNSGGGGGGGGAVAPHAPRVQGVHYCADGTPRYRPSAAEGPDAADTARAVHLQYNSPLGLYSKASAQEAMTGQLSGRPGEGTIQLTTESEVHKMLREEAVPRTRQSQRNAGGGGGDSQPVHQSPSMRALESQCAVDDHGISDF